MILKGTIYITGNKEIIYNTPLNSTTRIISLDEDDSIYLDKNAILKGTCLLPPVEAMIAEADGNEQLYDNIYSGYLLDPGPQEFMSAMLSYLYKGGNLLLYLPESDEFSTTMKLIQHIHARFGVHIGLIGHPNPEIANCYYDIRFTPIWLNMIYTVSVIGPYEYLANYPLEAPLDNNVVMHKLVDEISPVEDTIEGKINYIISLHKLLHNNPIVRPAIRKSFWRE